MGGVQDNLYFFCNVFNTAFKFQQAVITNKKISSGYFIFIPFMWKSYKLIVLVKLGPDLTSYLQLEWVTCVSVRACVSACVRVTTFFRHAARLAHVYLCFFFIYDTARVFVASVSTPSFPQPARINLLVPVPCSQ